MDEMAASQLIFIYIILFCYTTHGMGRDAVYAYTTHWDVLHGWASFDQYIPLALWGVFTVEALRLFC
jgi:hypothetical protein